MRFKASLRISIAVLSLAFFGLRGATALGAEYTYITNYLMISDPPLDPPPIVITGYNGPSGDVTIPSEIDGLPVIGVGGDAFVFCNTLTSVTIPEGVLRARLAAMADHQECACESK